MKIKKHEMIYNLDIYAKTYASGNNLCLADVQGDYDKIDFGSKHSASVAFKAISKAYDEGITYIDFDEVDRQVQQETDRIRSAGQGIDRMRGYREAPSARGMSGFHIRNGSTLGEDGDHAEPEGFNLRFRVTPDGHMEQVDEPTPVFDEAQDEGDEGPQEPERDTFNPENEDDGLDFVNRALGIDPSPQPCPEQAPEEDNASDEMVERVRRALGQSLSDSPVEIVPLEEHENADHDVQGMWNNLLHVNPAGAEINLAADTYARNIEQWQNEMNERLEQITFQNSELRNEISLLQERLRSNTHDQVRMPETGEAEREHEILRSILGNREE